MAVVMASDWRAQVRQVDHRPRDFHHTPDPQVFPPPPAHLPVYERTLLTRLALALQWAPELPTWMESGVEEADLVIMQSAFRFRLDDGAGKVAQKLIEFFDWCAEDDLANLRWVMRETGVSLDERICQASAQTFYAALLEDFEATYAEDTFG